MCSRGSRPVGRSQSGSRSREDGEVNYDFEDLSLIEIAEGIARLLFWPVVGAVALFVALKVLT